MIYAGTNEMPVYLGADEITAIYAGDEQIYPYSIEGFKVRPDALNFSTKGGTKRISIVSEFSWTATSSASWITISSGSGESGRTFIEVTVGENDTELDRDGYVEITASDPTYTSSITVSQVYRREPTGYLLCNGGRPEITTNFQPSTAFSVNNYLRLEINNDFTGQCYLYRCPSNWFSFEKGNSGDNCWFNIGGSIVLLSNSAWKTTSGTSNTLVVTYASGTSRTITAEKVDSGGTVIYTQTANWTGSIPSGNFIILTSNNVYTKFYRIKVFNSPSAEEPIYDFQPAISDTGKVCIFDAVNETYHYPASGANIAFQPLEVPANPLTLNITSNGTLKFGKLVETAPDVNVSYKVNNGDWVPSTGFSISVSQGDTVQMLGANPTYCYPTEQETNYKPVSFSGTTAGFTVSGNIMSLIRPDKYPTSFLANSTYNFRGLFRDCTGLTNASALILPADVVPYYAYSSMFSGCSGLTYGPEVLASTVNERGCDGMFNNCTSIDTPPDLLPTTIGLRGYNNMFAGCSSLLATPELTATKLAERAYAGMFQGCAALQIAGRIGDATYGTSTYSGMFYNCPNLSSITCLVSNPNTAAFGNWVSGVSATGTFVKDENATWTTGLSGIPQGWSIEDFDRCEDYGDLGYESYEDCRCGEYSDCPPEDPCDDWQGNGYSSYEECTCAEYGENCEEEEPGE